MSHEQHGNSDHWQLHSLCNSLSRLTSMKTSKLCITGPLWGEPTGGFPLLKASNSESVSMLCHHHVEIAPLIIMSKTLSICKLRVDCLDVCQFARYTKLLSGSVACCCKNCIQHYSPEALLLYGQLSMIAWYCAQVINKIGKPHNKHLVSLPQRWFLGWFRCEFFGDISLQHIESLTEALWDIRITELGNHWFR